ncbi:MULTISPECIES: DUF1430 domain-containing protein [unclassified Staphylococcus]|uniref:DUF1430 domain-containing protein n=1 Tax=unclassified Staphylococcus TaxID=91994 RepID=UPI0021D26496|nr:MULTISPECIES: DUF1430 domain-containing protein [unclassified Staphylococcus]UXR78864.1 DUF1430 domain-containing protein [Staphylococcus sp. IVB6227]UXR83024.1 DUF1430 domain-containing protein [Staphylococcus sp. IVB6214]
MKKIILTLGLIVTLVLNILLIDTVKSLSMYNDIGKDSHKIQLSFEGPPKVHSKDALKYFEKLASKYHVTFTKVTYVRENKVVVNSNDKTLLQKVNKDKELKLFDSSLNIKVYTLKESKFSAEGIYYLKGQNIQQVIDIINQDVGKAVEVDNSIFTFLPENLSIIPYLLLLLLIFTAVFLHFLKNRKSDIKLVYDLGYSQSQISRYIIKQHRNYLVSYGLLSIVFTCVIYFFIYRDYYFFKVILLMLVTFILLFMLISMFFYAVIRHFLKSYAKNNGQSNNSIMMYIYMLLSIVIVFAIVISTKNIIGNFTVFQKQEESLKYWNTTKNIYRTNELDIGQVRNKSFNAAVNRQMKKYYNSEDNHGFVIDSENFLELDETPLYVLEKIETPDINPAGKTITIDEHYLERHPKRTIYGEKVIDKLKNDKNTINILVPIQFKKYEKKLIENYLEELMNMKYLNKASEMPRKNQKVNIIWMKSNEQFFTYDSEIGGKKNTITHPIAIVELGYTNELNYEKYYCGTYFFESYLDDPYETIYEGLKKYRLDGVIPSITSIYNTKIDIVKELEKEIYKYTGLVLFTIITFILTTLTFIQIYFKSFQFSIFLKRTLGYSYWSIHKWMILFIVSLHVFMGVLLLPSHNIIAISVFLAVTMIELLSVVYTFMKLNRENVNLVLKGKKDD